MIGREKEQRILRELAESDHSQLAVVYGRRRVGKTYMIRETFQYRFSFSHTGVEGGTAQDELFAFWESLRDAGHECARPCDWWEAFRQLKRLLESSSEAKKTVFLDELPWMDTPKSGFTKALESFWNGWASARRDIFLVVCGSAAAWMTKNVLQSRGGLFNRASRQIFLEPFTLAECERFALEKGLALDRRSAARPTTGTCLPEGKACRRTSTDFSSRRMATSPTSFIASTDPCSRILSHTWRS